MRMKNRWCLCLSAVLFVVFVSCSGSFDDNTGLYSNKSKGFSIQFPAGWTKTRAQTGALVTVTDPDETAQMNIVVQELPDDISIEQYLRNVASQGRSIGARVKGSGELKIDGADAHWSMVTITVGGRQFTSLNYYAMKGGRVYSIVSTCASEEFTGFRNVFETAVGSFRFTG